MNQPTGHILIVGAGVIGVCCAYELASRGYQVTILERDAVGQGCSFGNAGLISLGHLPIPRPGVIGQTLKWMADGDSPLYIEPRLDLDLARWLWKFRAACTHDQLERSMDVMCGLSRLSEAGFRHFAQTEHLDFNFRPLGYYEVYLTEKALDRACRSADVTRAHGYAYERLDAQTIQDREPALSGDSVGAIWYPDSFFCDPYLFVREVGKLVRRMGVVVRENVEVQSFIEDGDAIRGVRTTLGESIEADHVVLAAGIWSQALAKKLRLRMPLQAAKGYHRDIPETDPPLSTSCLLGEANMVATPMSGHLRLAGTLEFSGVNLDMRRNRLNMLTEGARRYLPSINGAPPTSEWVGMRPCLPDGLPIIGWAPHHQNLFIATGHAMLGLTFGPATGRLVAESIAQEETSIAIDEMRADRF